MWKSFINTYSSLTSFAKSSLSIWISILFFSSFRFSITIMSRSANPLVICKCIIDIRNYMQLLMCTQTCSMTMPSTLISTSWVEPWNHHGSLTDDDDIATQNSHNINEAIAAHECFRQTHRLSAFHQSHRPRQHSPIAAVRRSGHPDRHASFLIRNRPFNKLLSDWSKCNSSVHPLRSDWTKSNSIDLSLMPSSQEPAWDVRQLHVHT